MNLKFYITRLRSKCVRGATHMVVRQRTLLQPCLTWQGAKDNTGYGVMRCARDTMGLRSGIVRVHRLVYYHYNGPFPQHMQIDHVCRNRLCCEPSHLKMVGPSEHGAISQRDQKEEEEKEEWVDHTCGNPHCTNPDHLKVVFKEPPKEDEDSYVEPF